MLSATFESYDKDFVYSIDYSNLYNNYSNLYNNSISNENEYFDIARLNGWKLQFITEGMGIWINEDVENAVPFLLEEEYLRMEKEDYQKECVQLNELQYLILRY